VGDTWRDRKGGQESSGQRAQQGEGHTVIGAREADHTTARTQCSWIFPSLRSIWIIGDGTLRLELDGEARPDSEAVFPYD